MNHYLTKAQKLYALSKKELNNAKHSNDDEIARDAAGKAWIATTDGFLGFLLTNSVKEKDFPKSERSRQNLLARYGNEKMRQLYGRIVGDIHQRAYYEGIINYTFLFEAFSDVKKFIHRCRTGAKSA
ncbi:MAG: hypothetical protein FVQ77_04590 [Cytophagales bacterium]|nr:hypothetical protein [Cytophagales bacterium]